jgi:hypothetical protein
MRELIVVAQPQPEGDWVHRFRNFGEEAWVRLRSACDIDIAEIDASFDLFHIRGIRDESAVAEAVRTLCREHHLDDSVFIREGDTRAAVIVILDPRFGEKIFDIPTRHPVWIAGSEMNRAAAGELHPDTDVTTWSHPFEAITEDDWLGILEVLDRHHGPLAGEPPVDRLLVYGPAVTPAITAALREYEFPVVLPTPAGFLALRDNIAPA